MSSYELTIINGIAARKLDHSQVDGIAAAVYAIPETGKGMIDDGEKLYQYSSPSSALAAWWDWLFADDEETADEQ